MRNEFKSRLATYMKDRLQDFILVTKIHDTVPFSADCRNVI